MKIIDYINVSNLSVQFENGYTVKTTYQHFKEGDVTSVYDKTVYGVGYLGEGEYKGSIDKKYTPQYNRWKNMLIRCYTKKYKDINMTYKDCTVCDEWSNFQNFAKWYDENYYEVDQEVMGLDKDILIKGNKVYSPDTCIFVPNSINILFTKTDKKRGEFPIGVHYYKKLNKYHAQCHQVFKKTQKHLGYYENPIDAFNAYKSYKEKTIKIIADQYKSKIPEKLYKALYSYEVDIND